MTSLQTRGSTDVSVVLHVNGRQRLLQLDSRVTLLDALREDLGLIGTKKGCDQGACGACTVLADGKRILSCLTLAAQCDGYGVTGRRVPSSSYPGVPRNWRAVGRER